MEALVLGVLPYITVAVFIVGMVIRIRIWMRTPQPAKITLFPAPCGGRARFINVLKESFLFPSLFRGDRTLWIIAWLFHLTLAFVFVGHVRVFTDFPRVWAALGIDADTMSAAGGGVAGVLILTMALLLTVRRAAMRRVREVSQLADYLALFLVIGVILTGNLMRFGDHFDLQLTRAYFTDLFTFSLGASSYPANGMFAVHFLLAQILIVFMPFSKIMHFGGIFFTQTLIQKA
ncbi:MAG: respiratory nitrate reductase subunit gamma [Candidatus Zixiibacteriota bacterium]